MSTMKAVAVTAGKADSLQMIETPRPEPQPGEALVRVLQIGICGTDREIIAGEIGEAPPGDNHLIIGHESFGIVERVNGDGPLKPGDHVAAIVRRPDQCGPCQAGRWDFCLSGDYTERGIRARHGFLSEYYSERSEFLVPVPATLVDVGVLIEPTTVLAKAMQLIEDVQRRLPWLPRRAIVLGAGPIGLFGAFLLRLRGLEVTVVDIVPADSPKAKLVTACGADYVNGREQPLPELARQTGNIDVIIEATGVASLVFQAMDVLGVNGVLVLTGISGGTKSLEVDGNKLNLDIVLKNKLVVGSVNANRSHFQAAVNYAAAIEARWPGLLSRMISRVTPLADFQAAYAPDPNIIKSVIQVSV